MPPGLTNFVDSCCLSKERCQPLGWQETLSRPRGRERCVDRKRKSVLGLVLQQRAIHVPSEARVPYHHVLNELHSLGLPIRRHDASRLQLGTLSAVLCIL